MKNRRTFLLTLTSGLVALAVLAAPVIAEELFGVVTKVDVEGKKLTVTPKGEDKSVEVTVTDNTEFITKKGTMKVDLEKLAKGVAKRQDEGKKGIMLKIEHERSASPRRSTPPRRRKTPRRKNRRRTEAPPAGTDG